MLVKQARGAIPLMKFRQIIKFEECKFGNTMLSVPRRLCCRGIQNSVVSSPSQLKRRQCSSNLVIKIVCGSGTWCPCCNLFHWRFHIFTSNSNISNLNSRSGKIVFCGTISPHCLSDDKQRFPFVHRAPRCIFRWGKLLEIRMIWNHWCTGCLGLCWSCPVDSTRNYIVKVRVLYQWWFC